MADSLPLTKKTLTVGDSYRLCNGTQIDGILFVVVAVHSNGYDVRAHHPPIYFADSVYYILQEAVEEYEKRGQLIHDNIRECSV